VPAAAVVADGGRVPRNWILVVVAVTLVGGGLRARVALEPHARQSADERSYVSVAIGLADTGRYGKRSLHWPPGAPLAFAAAAKLSGRVERGPAPDIPAAYWVQWLAGTALIPLAFALALATTARCGRDSRPPTPRASTFTTPGCETRRSRGPLWAGLVAAAIVATYPPLIGATGDLLSEPLGALWLTAALLALAVRRPALGGALLAAAVLTRANLLVLIPVLVVVLALGRQGAWRFAVAAIVPVAAWSLHVGAPVTTGGGSSLFVGTYLPGHGTLPGAKRALKAETVRFAPELAARHAKDLPGDRVLDAVAARRPALDRDGALREAAITNLTTYPREHPTRFAAMVASKLPRLWLGPSRDGGGRTGELVRLWHALLVLVAIAGLLAGRNRTILAALIAFTLFHLIAGAMPRYALPLLPALIATGTAGWFARLAQPRTTSSVRAYSDPLRRASISAGPATESASRIAPRSPISSSTTQLATPSPSAIAAKPTGPKSSDERA
jgi:hypothetical protein